jgi:hypothetical protein
MIKQTDLKKSGRAVLCASFKAFGIRPFQEDKYVASLWHAYPLIFLHYKGCLLDRIVFL